VLLREWPHELTCVAAAHLSLARSQRGATTIPGADTVTYMNEDLDIFSWALPESDMRTLDAQTEPGRQYWDPHQIP
jgi:diketogulonate reductase-like aldo/keto reductase